MRRNRNERERERKEEKCKQKIQTAGESRSVLAMETRREAMNEIFMYASE